MRSILKEKSKGLLSLNGIVGLETAFPVIYTEFVKSGQLTLEKVIEIMSVNPSERFGIDVKIADGKQANLAVFDLEKEYVINPDEFLSKGRSTPFKGRKVYGKCLVNFCNGRKVYDINEK